MAPSAEAGGANGASGGGGGRALGATEENWSRATATGTGVQVLGIALRRSVGAELVAQAAREVVSRSAVLRSQIVESAKGKLSLEPSKQSNAPAVEQLPWPTPTKGDDEGRVRLPGDEGGELGAALQAAVQKELNIPLPNAAGKITGPVDLWRVHVYDGQDRTLIALKFNSGVLDRPSAIAVTQSFLAALNAAVAGRAPTSDGGDAKVLPPLEDLVPKGKASKWLIQKGLDTVGYAMSASKFSQLPFAPGFFDEKRAPFQTDFLNYTLGKEEYAALLARAKEEKTTYAAALSAAFLRSVANAKELKDKKLEKFSFNTLMDVRPLFEPAIPDTTLGNYTAGIPQDEHMKASRKFWDVARSVSGTTEKEMGKMRHFSELPVLNMLFSQILKRPNLTPKSSLRTTLFSVFVDGPMDAQWRDVDQLELAGTCGPFLSMHGIGPCFCLAEALLAGPELGLALVFPTPVYSREQMHALAQSSFEMLATAVKQAA